MILSADAIYGQLTGRGYAAVPLPFLLPTHIERLASTFFRVLALPDEVKQKLSFISDPERDTEMGYMRKKGGAGAKRNDLKEYFHYSPMHHVELRSLADESSFAAVAAFLDQALIATYEAMHASAVALHMLESRIPGIAARYLRSAGRQPKYLLRCLKYEQPVDGFLARGHFDKGGLTLALAESAPGLRMGRSASDIRPVEHKPGTALFFPGLRFIEPMAAPLFPVWHDVIDLGQRITDGVARWAFVFFWDPHEMSPIRAGEVYQGY